MQGSELRNPLKIIFEIKGTKQRKLGLEFERQRGKRTASLIYLYLDGVDIDSLSKFGVWRRREWKKCYFFLSFHGFSKFKRNSSDKRLQKNVLGIFWIPASFRFFTFIKWMQSSRALYSLDSFVIFWLPIRFTDKSTYASLSLPLLRFIYCINWSKQIFKAAINKCDTWKSN